MERSAGEPVNRPLGIQWQEVVYPHYDRAIRDAVERWRDGGWKIAQIANRFGGAVVVYCRPDVNRDPGPEPEPDEAGG